MAHYKFHNDCQSSVLTFEQVKRLDFVIDQTVPIHARQTNYPTLYVKLKELIRLVKSKLQQEHSIEVRDVRLNGGASNFVLAPENSHYNDLDLIFGVDLTDETRFDVIRDVVLEAIGEFMPKGTATANASDITLRTTTNANSASTTTTTTTTTNTATNTTNNIASATTTTQQPRQPDQHNEKENNNNININNNLDREAAMKNGHVVVVDSGGLQSQAGEEVARSLHQQHQPPLHQMPLTSCAIREAYVHKMVKVNDDDRWSLISLGVQPSETASCGQLTAQPSCCLQQQQKPQQQTSTSSLESSASNQHQLRTTHSIVSADGQQQFLVTIASNNNDNNNDNKPSDKQQQHIDKCNNARECADHKANSCNNKRNECHHNQFPNSIELKFVDRMRRKFEFSVDSFQIILDSLIDFYDYAPQSNVASHRLPLNSHPSSIIINARPLMSATGAGGCLECFIRNSPSSKSLQVDLGLKPNSAIASKKYEEQKHGNNDDYRNDHLKNRHQHNHSHHNNHSYQKHQQFHENIRKGFSSSCNANSTPLTSNSHRYYQLSIEAPNSQSIPSSSGCSSSSSVVSSSSSSLSSCDDDLCCEPESSSPNSSSSLVSSPTISSLSLNGPYSMPEPQLSREEKARSRSSPDPVLAERARRKIVALRRSETAEDSKDLLLDKMMTNKDGISSQADHNCIECFKQHQNQHHRVLIINNCVNDLDLNITTPCAVISENFYPTVIGRSEYGNFKEALYHLEKKLIATRSPEEIRGGGLLKYCNLLVKNYKPKNIYQIRTLERYMCSRFFIDFSDLNQQQAKLESYLRNHFSDDPVLKFDYLTILHNVVQRSTVCLMNHELRLTLNMIRDLAYKLTTGIRQLYVNRM